MTDWDQEGNSLNREFVDIGCVCLEHCRHHCALANWRQLTLHSI